MDKELIEEILSYIESNENDWDWERGSCRSIADQIKDKAMPDLYYKLKGLIEK